MPAKTSSGCWACTATCIPSWSVKTSARMFVWCRYLWIRRLIIVETSFVASTYTLWSLLFLPIMTASPPSCR